MHTSVNHTVNKT